jgi:hypothetical protein
MREVKKLGVGLAGTWKLRIEPAADLESAGSRCAMRAGPWLRVSVNDIVFLAMQVSVVEGLGR